MILDDIEPALIEARGQYATVRAAYEDHMKDMGDHARTASHLLSKGLNIEDHDEAYAHFTEAARLATKLSEMLIDRDDLRGHVELLKPIAWGDK